MRIRFLIIPIIITLGLFSQSCHSAKQAERKKMAYMKRTYRVLNKKLNDADVVRLQDTVKVIFPNNLTFAINSAQIVETVKPQFIRFSKALNKFNRTKILINGHTDSTGTESHNAELSLSRAKSAKALLVENAVDDTRLFTWGLGSKQPVQSNKDEAGRAKNRRVEFIILYNHPAQQ